MLTMLIKRDIRAISDVEDLLIDGAFIGDLDVGIADADVVVRKRTI